MYALSIKVYETRPVIFVCYVNLKSKVICHIKWLTLVQETDMNYTKIEKYNYVQAEIVHGRYAI